MKKLLLIALLIVGCDLLQEEEFVVVEFPNQTGNYWTYACNETLGDHFNKSGYSFIKIIDNFPINYIIDYCGEETIIFEKTDSISIFEYESPSPLVIEESDDPAPLPVNIVIDSVKVDTLIYSMTEDSIAYCLSASSLNQNSSDLGSIGRHFYLSQPPKIQYPLFIGQSWKEPYGNSEPKQYEVISSQYVATENKIYNCYLIKMLLAANIEYNYYISSEGLIKSTMYAEGDRNFSEHPDGTGEIEIAKYECILVNTNPL